MVDVYEDSLALVPSRHGEWVESFITERDRLEDLLVGESLWYTVERIHHVGSTAVSGLAAKDIVDLDIVVQEDAVFDVARAIESELGGTRFENERGWHPVFRRADGQRFNDHVFASSNHRWKISVVTRDVLRERADLRREYERLKRRLAAEHDGLEAYSVGKTPFIQQLLEVAHEDPSFDYPFDIPQPE